jgi:hemolysin activation/secretion protein
MSLSPDVCSFLIDVCKVFQPTPQFGGRQHQHEFQRQQALQLPQLQQQQQQQFQQAGHVTTIHVSNIQVHGITNFFRNVAPLFLSSNYTKHALKTLQPGANPTIFEFTATTPAL